MKKKNIFAVGVASVLCVTTLFGCSGGGGLSDDEDDEPLENGVVNIVLNKAGYGTGWIDDAIPGFEKELQGAIHLDEPAVQHKFLQSFLLSYFDF